MLFIGFVTDTNTIIYRTLKYHLSPEQYQTEDLESYPKAFLIMIIKWYEQQTTTFTKSSNIVFIPLHFNIVKESQALISLLHISADYALQVYTAYTERCNYFICDA